MFVTRGTTKRQLSLVETHADGWKNQPPTYMAGFLPVSEGIGTIHGSIFCFWIGVCDVASREVVQAIEDFIDDHDVAGLRFIRNVPENVHVGIAEAVEAARAQLTA